MLSPRASGPGALCPQAPYISDNIRKIMAPPFVGLFNLTMGYHRRSHIPMYFGPTMTRLFDPPPPVTEKTTEAPIMWVCPARAGVGVCSRCVTPDGP